MTHQINIRSDRLDISCELLSSEKSVTVLRIIESLVTYVEAKGVERLHPDAVRLSLHCDLYDCAWKLLAADDNALVDGNDLGSLVDLVEHGEDEANGLQILYP